jgi:hypothetical protein
MPAETARMNEHQAGVRRERRAAQPAEQQGAVNAELRNRRAVEPAEQLEARNAAFRCRKPGGGRELNPDLLLAGQVCYTLHLTPRNSGHFSCPHHVISIITVVCRSELCQAIHFSCREGGIFFILLPQRKSASAETHTLP